MSLAYTTDSSPNSARRRASARLAASRSRVGFSANRRSCSLVAAQDSARSSTSITPAASWRRLQTQADQIENLRGIERRHRRAQRLFEPVAVIDQQREPERDQRLMARRQGRKQRMKQLLDRETAAAWCRSRHRREYIFAGPALRAPAVRAASRDRRRPCGKADALLCRSARAARPAARSAGRRRF